MSRNWFALGILVTAVGLPSFAGQAPIEFIPLPVGAAPTGISADGSTVVGFSPGGAFLWTETGGYVPITGNANIGGLIRASADGSTIIGTAGSPASAAIWLGGSSWQELGGLGPTGCPDLGSGYSVSGDGEIVVGLGWDGCDARGFYWSQGTGTIDLGTLVPDRATRANDISTDGNVIVGWQDLATGQRVAAKWVNLVESFILGDGGRNVGEALATNNDGSIIVGRQCITPGDAWFWTPGNGIVCAGLPGSQDSIADTSDNGEIMVGWWNDNPFLREATIYLDGEPVFLEDWLADFGINDLLAFDTSGTASAVSGDGTIIAGSGFNSSFQTQGYVIKLTLEAGQCGDGEIGVGETCDPPGSPAGENENLCRDDCTVCGDNVVNGPRGAEACDDGNGIDGDGCDNDCKMTPGVPASTAPGVAILILMLLGLTAYLRRTRTA